MTVAPPKSTLAVDPATAAAASNVGDRPVLMVVAGPTHDRARMMAYGKAIAESGLYEQLGGYYLNLPPPLAQLEGTPPPGYVTLIIRFSSLAHARTFWSSKVYQEQIKPLRLDPSAGDFVVTVYAEATVREDMVGKVGDNAYTAQFSVDGIPQVEGATP